MLNGVALSKPSKLHWNKNDWPAAAKVRNAALGSLGRLGSITYAPRLAVGWAV
jgi:hypothetical protein